MLTLYFLSVFIFYYQHVTLKVAVTGAALVRVRVSRIMKTFLCSENAWNVWVCFCFYKFTGFWWKGFKCLALSHLSGRPWTPAPAPLPALVSLVQMISPQTSTESNISSVFSVCTGTTGINIHVCFEETLCSSSLYETSWVYLQTSVLCEPGSQVFTCLPRYRRLYAC